jgi:hypothetical protein
VTTDAPPFEVLPKQTYVPCKTDYLWGETVHKPFVVWVVDGDRVKVWDPTGGQRMGGFRWIARRNLHESGTTARGKERRTGFRLRCGPPTSKDQELCGSCFRWVDPEGMAVSAWTLGHSTCKPCKAEIDERYGTLS